MGNLWIYIRTLFEEKYSKKENPFRCVIESVNNGKSRCICIPCVAVNYIAHQMKFCTKTPAGFNIWDMEWNSEYETYFIKKKIAVTGI